MFFIYHHGLSILRPDDCRDSCRCCSKWACKLYEAVDFVIMGDDSNTVKVDLIFMLAMKEEHAELELLQSLMGILQDENALNYIKNEKSIDNIKNFWGEQEIKLVRFELENDQNYYAKVPRISNVKNMYEVHILDER